MEKAYDLTWRHVILMDLNKAVIEGSMLSFIQKFLNPRFFRVKVNEILSETKIQTEAIPQGNVVTPSFCILRINKIAAQLPNDNRFRISLHMDDLQVSYRHPYWTTVERKLNDSIDIVEKFAQKNGPKFSTSKTCMLNLTKLLTSPQVEFRLGKIRIKKSEAVKYLGLIFDSKPD